MISPIQQVKNHLLNVLRQASPEVKEIIYPCLPQDLGDYRRSLELIKVQQEFNRRGIKATLKIASPTGEILPDIVIATFDDVASGRLTVEPRRSLDELEEEVGTEGRRWVLGGLIPETTIMLLYADGGVGKTKLMYDDYPRHYT